MPTAAPQKPAESPTRAALIEAALQLFGAKGFEGASTREIAARAGANVAAIAYHFGGKEGLRLACVEAIADRLAAILAVDGLAPPASRAEARTRLDRILRAAVRFMVMPGPAQDFARFLIREINPEGPLVDVIHARIIGPRHRQLCQLWGVATGNDPESEDTRLTVFAMIGQMLYFRIGQPVILLRMRWEAMDIARADRIADILSRNLHAVLAASERNAP